MRSANEIKIELIRLRFKEKIPLAQIAKDSGCQIKQIMDAMQLVASETIQRRVDAYLDAAHLHVATKETKLLAKIEEYNREMWREYKMHSLPMKDVAKMTPRQQKIMCIRMEMRLFGALKRKYEAMGFKVFNSDGISYWRAKSKYVDISKGARGIPGSGKVDNHKNALGNAALPVRGPKA